VMNAEVLRPYVLQAVASVLGLTSVKVDDEGDIPIRQGSAVCYARLLDGPTGPLFRVFAPMLKNVAKSQALLERLNGLNAAAPYLRFFWVDGVIFCAMDLMAENLEKEEIGNALLIVGWFADKLDDMLRKDFGGERMLEEDEIPKPAAEFVDPSL
jgi:hypothetical protein